MKSRRQFVTTLAALSLPAAWSRAAILSCPKCGHEYQEGQATCGHCQAALPATTATAPVPAAPVEAPPPDAQTLDIGAARQLESLAMAAGAPEIAGRLEQSGRRLAESLRFSTQSCPVCRGKGKRLMLFANFAGEIQEQTAPNLACPLCNGAGTVRRQITKERADAGFGEAQRRLDALLRTLRYTDLGGLWVPLAVSEKLSATQMAALRVSLGQYCSGCHGFGVSGCEECGGAGRAACNGEGCVMGQRPCPDCGGKRKVTAADQNRSVQQSCRTCKQTGVVNCDTCAGRGWLPCEECEGSGNDNCSVCLGKGQTSVCGKCNGRGLVDCRNCQGSGQYRGATCTTCKGGKVTLCTSCTGSGRKRR